MTRQEREAVAQRICNFYIDASNKSVKTTVNYFMKQGFPRQTIYNIINKYLKYGQTTFLPRTGRPLKLSNRKLNQLVKCVNNRYGVSQRKLAYRFGVNQSTISRNLRQRTPIVIRKRRKAPQMNNQEQAKRAQRNCGKLYKTIPRDWNIILDDEKYFSLTNSDIGGNRFYYSTDPEETPIHIRFKQKKKFEPKLMIWMVMSSKGVSEIYIHESNQAVRQEIYLDECIEKRLIPFIRNHYHDQNFIFWPDLAKAHYANIVQNKLKQENIHFCVS